MAVKLIPRQTKWIEVDGSEFEIVYITPAKLSEYYNRFTERGNLDVVRVVEAVLAEYVKNWRGVLDENGNPIEFDKSLIGNLPLPVQNDVFSEIVKYATQSAGDVEKNS